MNHLFRRRAIAALLVAAGLAPAALADVLSEYLSLATGSFDSSAQAAADKRYDNAIWHTAEIWRGDPASRWTYTENWLEGGSKPYRQRISRYSVEADGSILVRSYPLPAPENFVGAWRNVDRFAELTPAELPADALCPARLARTGARRFEGGTTGQTCRNSYRGASYLVSRSRADETGLSNWDRGFTEAGEQVWGPVAGPYRFARLGAETCQAPVLMLVHGEIFDRKAFGAYVAALATSGLYPANQGYYRAISPAVDVFEGAPPPARGVVLARFPCLGAARTFWNSPAYQQIRQLRKDSARFEVSVFRELPVPDYVNRDYVNW